LTLPRRPDRCRRLPPIDYNPQAMPRGIREGAWGRLRFHLAHPLPVFTHLVLRTESHAYCAGLAFFALVAFYPCCLLLLWVSGDLLHWSAAESVIRETLREYYPEAQTFLVRNLEVSLRQHGRELTLSAAFWILLGAAGVFIPLETAFNQMWGVSEHRPYVRNQAVGFLLTSACGGLAFLFVFATAGLQTAVSSLTAPPLVERALGYTVLRLGALCVSATAIFLFYRFLPNHRVRSADVWPAAVVAGVMAEAIRWLYLLALPSLQLQRSQGPYYVSVSFALLAYVEAFVLLGGAYLAARPASDAGPEPPAPAPPRPPSPPAASPEPPGGPGEAPRSTRGSGDRIAVRRSPTTSGWKRRPKARANSESLLAMTLACR
jgi:membrane protein